MNWNDFISKYDAICEKGGLSKQVVEEAEKTLKCTFGPQLESYLLNCGFLCGEGVELYGINARQGMDSDLVKKTLYLYKYFPCVEGFIAIENQGEGLYYLVDGYDKVYSYLTGDEKCMVTGETLLEFIVRRFAEELEE